MERNIYNRLLIYKKRQLISKQVIDSKGNTKKLYKLTAHLAGINMDNPVPLYDNDESLTNHFADYFISKVDKIHEKFIGIPAIVPKVMDTPTLKTFAPLTPSPVTNLIAKMQTRSWELDPIPTHVLKQMLPVIISTITHIINTSLNHACFYKEWKTPTVRPLLKKKGFDLLDKNFRPVSNLPFLSKLAGQATLGQFNQHCDEHQLLLDFQSAYRQGYST